MSLGSVFLALDRGRGLTDFVAIILVKPDLLAILTDHKDSCHDTKGTLMFDSIVV